MQRAYWDPNKIQVESHRLILLQDASLVVPQGLPSFVTMTARPSRKAPSSLLSAAKASSARARSGSRLKAKAGTDGAIGLLDLATPSPSVAHSGAIVYVSFGGCAAGVNVDAVNPLPDVTDETLAANAPPTAETKPGVAPMTTKAVDGD